MTQKAQTTSVVSAISFKYNTTVLAPPCGHPKSKSPLEQFF